MKRRAGILVVGAATTEITTSPYSADIPAAAEDGDLLLMYLLKSGNTTAFPVPAGWTQLWNDTYGSSKIACFAKVRAAGETTASVTGVAGALNVAHILAIRGASTVDATNRSSSTSNSTTVTTPSVTTTAPNALVIRQAYFFNSGGSGPITWPGTQSPIVEYPSSSGTSRWSYVSAIQAAAGASGTVAASGSSGPRFWSTVAVKA